MRSEKVDDSSERITDCKYIHHRGKTFGRLRVEGL